MVFVINLMKAYPVELRIRVVNAADTGISKKDICKLFDIGRATLYRWLSLRSVHGTLNPKEGYQRGHSHKISNLSEFQRFVDSNADKSQNEMANLLGVGRKTVGRAMKRIGYTRKKNKKYTKSVEKAKDAAF